MAVPYLFDPAAYFRDDAEAQFAPTLVSLGRSLWSEGRVPLFTLQTWYGGNLAAEYQYGLFNPVLLPLYALAGRFETLTSAMAFLGMTLGAILGAGSYVLGRVCGLSSAFAHVAAISLVGSNFLTYWFAASWITGFASAAFMVWALAFLLRASEGRLYFMAAIIAVYLVATAGFFHAVLVAGAFTAARVGILAHQKRLRSSVDTALAAGLGVAAAAVAFLPLAGVMSVVERTSTIENTGVLVANLRDVLTLSNPLHLAPLSVFGERAQVLQIPIFYAAWFILPFAALVSWRRLNWRDPDILTLIAFTAFMLIATQGPSNFLWLRFPIKFLPYFHLGMILVTLKAVQDAGLGEPTRRRTVLLVLVLGGAAISSIQSAPGLIFAHLGVAVVLGGVTVAVCGGGTRPTAIGTAAVTLLIAASLRAFVSGTIGAGVFAAWHAPPNVTATLPMSAVPASYAFVAAPPPPAVDRARHVDELPFGQIGLVQGLNLLNGYSPIGHAALGRLLCWTSVRWPCADAVPNLFRTDAWTGRKIADLMRVDRIVVEKGPYFDRVAGAIPPPWRIAAQTPIAVILEQPLPNANLPGSVSWASPGLQLEAEGPARATHEALRLSGQAGTVVFARLAWPGYRATLDGAAVPVRAHDDILVAVDLPAGADGRILRLTFVPAGLETGMVISLVAAAMAILYLAIWPTGRRRSDGSVDD